MLSNSRVPSLSKVCVSKIVGEIKQFCCGADFDELGNHSAILGPLENLSSPCVEIIFKYVISTKQLNQAWLAVLIVSHLKTIDFSDCLSIIDTELFNTLLQRCRRLETLLIPNCKKIPNASLCQLLRSNPSLLALDISNKLNPSIDQQVMETLVHSCRYLTVLKISDYRLDDPKRLLVLCGRVAVSPPTRSDSPTTATPSRDSAGGDGGGGGQGSEEVTLLNSDLKSEAVGSEELVDRVTNQLAVMEQSNDDWNCASCTVKQRVGCSSSVGACCCSSQVRNVTSRCIDDSDRSLPGNMEVAVSNGKWEEEGEVVEEEEEKAGNHYSTKEEEQNQERDNEGSEDEENQGEREGEGGGGGRGGGSSDDPEDIYEDDSTASPLEVEDHSDEFGCLELETLWLENINVTDQVAAVLLESLPQLRDVTLCYTDICNPWRLLDGSRALHLKNLADLDVKSTALSRTALQLIPEYHPALQKLAISSTTLPPPTYCHVAKLSGLAELELIGGQFYPCEPEEIFSKGIMPAVSGVGEHLQSLNLTYFAHVEFAKVILSCPIIRHLDLSHTDIFITYPCPSMGKECPNLTHLDLGHAHIQAKDTDGQYVVEERVTHLMIGECRALEELQLCGLTITDEGVRTMFPGAEYPLKVLNLSYCKKLTIAGIKHLWDRCPFLNSINMIHCKEVSVTDYKAFHENCQETRPIFRLEGTMQWK